MLSKLKIKLDYYETVVVLVNYNNTGDTIECIKSIHSSDTKSLPFVIVVDNDSTIKDVEEQMQFYPFQKVVFVPKNIGFGRANNIGIQWAIKNLESSYLFILNNDTIVEQSAIRKLITKVKDAPDDVALCAPKILVYDRPSEIWYGGGTINYKKMTPTIMSHSTDGFSEFASGCAMFFKTEALMKLNGFDPFFFMYDEDVELSMRIRKLGYRILYAPVSIIYHKCQGSQVKVANAPSNQLDPRHPSLLFYLTNTIPNRKYIIRKHLTGLQKLKSSVFQVLYWLMKSLQYLLYGKFKACYTVFKYLFLGSSKFNKYV
jgi:GT2 family glycosyltransferase